MAQKEEVLLAHVAAKTGALTSSSSGCSLLHLWPFCGNGVQKGHSRWPGAGAGPPVRGRAWPKVHLCVSRCQDSSAGPASPRPETTASAASVSSLTLSTLSPRVPSRVFGHFSLPEHPLRKAKESAQMVSKALSDLVF